MPERLTHAQALRVIGQTLSVLSLESFAVVKNDDDYVVSSGDPVRGQRSFLFRTWNRLLGRRRLKIPKPMRFSAPKILQIDAERRLQRAPGSPDDRHDLSFMLRVIGDYLDRKKVERFTIDWSQSSYNVHHDNYQERFTVEDLYNFGIRMYLRRANRSKDE